MFCKSEVKEMQGCTLLCAYGNRRHNALTACGFQLNSKNVSANACIYE